MTKVLIDHLVTVPITNARSGVFFLQLSKQASHFCIIIPYSRLHIYANLPY
ncbi:hypothetical protein N665_0092s0029 [Sinapis alba]|nr:hypothetical protein N665_0092s0029 [Sinapis alba]